MKSNDLFLGIDTSAYTTSVAVADGNENIIMDIRIPLRIKEGSRGLRQQEAVFQHIGNLEIIAERLDQIQGKIRAVSASAKPRWTEDSYMPVFTVSNNTGKFVSKMLGAHFYPTSHQRGHLRIALKSCSLEPGRYLAAHISGGTTEILEMEYSGNMIKESLLGGSGDISAGQLIDRTGVHLGFDFPSGRPMEDYLRDKDIHKLKEKYTYKAFFKEGKLNLSGIESHIMRVYHSNGDMDSAIYNVFINTAQVLTDMIKYYSKETGVHTVVISGGVASNTLIKNYVTDNLNKCGIQAFFCSKSYTTDNAAGIALIAKDMYKENGHETEDSQCK
ncbi:MAG: hypothetical protein HGA49_11725 [Eubacteriaceae bacterium]|nr:hypothetical protein [Eubacteriaceae bacterium]